MLSTIRWEYKADNAGLHTSVGERGDGRIKISARSGWALFGPYLDLPPGRCRVRVHLAGPAKGTIRLALTSDFGKTMLASEKIGLSGRSILESAVTLPGATTAFEVRISCHGSVALDIARVEIELDRDLADEPLSPDRAVGFETSKTYADKIDSGFFRKYLSGPAVMEIGYKGYDGATVPVVPQAIGVDVGYPGYDGETFPFADESFDAIYSSHCFEHIGPWKAVLRDWYRMLRVGGFLIIIVPHQLLFERKRHLPSYFNGDHKRYYTAKSLLGEIEEALEENGYRIRRLVENDKDFDFAPSPREGSSGCYEIELVVEKVALPYWHPDDGSVRAYPAGEFRTAAAGPDPWSLDLDLSESTQCLTWGPYIALAPAHYIAEFHFDPIDLASGAPTPQLFFDVGHDGRQIAVREIKGNAARDILRIGKLALPFSNDTFGPLFEFRILVGTGCPLTLKFRGVNVIYARLPRL